MFTRKKVLLFLSLFLLLLVSVIVLLFAPLIIIFAQDLIGAIINPKFSLCELMDKPRLEEALKDGFNINAGCCTEHMIGECSIARANSTPLVMAVESNKIEAVQLLLEHAAEVNQSSQSGYPLALAAAQGNLDIVRLLLEYRTDAASQDVALRMAAHYGQLEIAKLILAKVDPSHISAACTLTACSLVTELQQLQNDNLPTQRELFLHIINQCLDPDAFCDTERILSSIARDENNLALVKALLERGADLNALEKNGKSVKQYLQSFWDYESRPAIKKLIED